MYDTDEIVKKFSDLKTLPHVAIRVGQLIGSENATMHDFEEVIKLDPVLVTRLLRLVNSPYFGMSNEVDSIAKAVVFVGMKHLRNLVAVEALRDMFRDKAEDSGFSRRALWLHCATVAILCEMIAKRIFGIPGEDYFLAGIIHDIGLIAEDQVAAVELRATCEVYAPEKGTLPVFERERIGTDHCRVGAALARDWGIPDEVLKAIRFHHDRERGVEVDSCLGILMIAEYFAGRMKYSTIPGRVESLPPQLVGHVKSKMADYKVIVRDLPEEIAKASELYNSEDDA